MAVPESYKKTNEEAATDAGKSPFWTPGRVAITLAGAVLIAGYGISRWSSDGNVANNPSTVNRTANRPVVTNEAPAPAVVPLPQGLRETAVQTIDGESLKLSDYADKVVVLNIWATWCGPCRLEMPELIKISNEYKARGLVVLGVATTYNEQNDPQRVKNYVKAQNVPYKIIWDDGTLAGPLVEAVQARSVIPQSFVIDRGGRIVKHFSGFNVYQTPQLMRQAIEESLNNKG
ncbi:MAG TPA: TlpA disulfide reductase family protein [Pyrinomonadaceae bacterium]|nr:TlpA disulfide reductase family protein [Pyrinomonadaceae bacterium]